MKHIAKSLVVMGAMVAAGSASADMMADFNPYVGVDYYHAWMQGKHSPGHLFPKSYPGMSVYLGNKFTECFGLEAGYDFSVSHAKKSWTTDLGVTGSTKIRRSGGHLDLVGFLPMNDCVNLLGSIGYGWVQPDVHMTVNSVPSTAAANNQASALRSVAGKGGSVFRIGAGADWMATDMFGLRAKLGWESTGSLKIKGNQAFSNLNYHTKAFKSSVTLNVGGFVKF